MNQIKNQMKNQMKNQNKSTNRTRFGVLAALTVAFFLSSVAFVQAQNTTAEIAKKTEVNYTAAALTVDGSIRVIDNWGTIKYLQTANGLTTLTNTSGTDVTTTTLQLGGTLTDDTYIDVDGNVFAFDGITLITTETASTNAISESDHGTGTGYTLLVRDEATGAVKKMMISDLGVVGGQESFTVASPPAVPQAYTLATGPTLTLSKTYVYRNGAKLVAGTDYTVAADTVTLTLANHPVFAGDVIEVHYIN